MNIRGYQPLQSLSIGCAIALALGTAAHADVTIEERMVLRGEGLMKMANMSGTTITTIADDRARTESTLRFDSGMMRTFAGGAGHTIEIVRLDEDRILMLDPGKKTYTETTFEQQRAEMQQAMEQMRSGQASQQQATSGVDESQCKWSEPKADVKRTGERATIGGFGAERVTITATQSCTDRESGQVCDFGLVLDQWLAPDFAAAEEANEYHRRYAEKLGLGATASRDVAERAEVMFGRYKGIWTEVAAKMRDVEGYPVKGSFSLGVGGPQCQSAQQAQDGAAATPNIGDAIGGALGGLFRKKKEASAPAAEASASSLPGGLIPLMTLTTELVSVQQGDVASQTFEVPPEYKKRDR